MIGPTVSPDFAPRSHRNTIGKCCSTIARARVMNSSFKAWINLDLS